MDSLRAPLAAIVAAFREKVGQRRNVAAPTPQTVAEPETQQPAQPDQAEPQVVFWLAGARKAIALKQTIYLALWLALHHINRHASGSGILSTGKHELEKIARLVGLSPDYIRTILKHGDGTWWQRLPGARIRLFSQEKVNKHLTELATRSGITDPGEPDVHCRMPLSTLKAGLVTFQGSVFSAWLAERGPNGFMATWDALARLWGHSRAQLEDWIKATGIIKQHNAGYKRYPQLSPDKLGTLEEELRQNPDDAGFSHSGIWLEVHEGQVYLGFQRGNTYYSASPPRRTRTAGKARKVNQAIRECAGDYGDEIIRDAIGRPGGFIAHPDPHPVGVTAGRRSSDVLSDLFPALDGSGAGLLAAWNKLTEKGRIFWKRTNYRDSEAFRKARRKRPDADLYLFQNHVRIIRTNGFSRTKWWGIWLHVRAET